MLEKPPVLPESERPISFWDRIMSLSSELHKPDLSSFEHQERIKELATVFRIPHKAAAPGERELFMEFENELPGLKIDENNPNRIVPIEEDKK